MVTYLLFLCIYVNWTYWPHFGLNILLYFPMAARLERLISVETKNIKFDRHYESGLQKRRDI